MSLLYPPQFLASCSYVFYSFMHSWPLGQAPTSRNEMSSLARPVEPTFPLREELLYCPFLLSPFDSISSMYLQQTLCFLDFSSFHFYSFMYSWPLGLGNPAQSELLSLARPEIPPFPLREELLYFISLFYLQLYLLLLACHLHLSLTHLFLQTLQ